MKYTLLMMMFFIFHGCSTKQAISPTQTEHIELSTQTKEENTDASEVDDGFDDEYDDETVEVADPLNKYNRMMTSVNDAMIIHALNPVSEAYAYVIPRPFRVGIANAIHNIQFPIRFVNNLLQGKFQNVSDETERFIVNSTVGLAGFMDPAKNYMNIPAHNEDFGQTLGYYGVGSGFHIVLPFFGPSNVRDLVGLTIDAYLSPLINVRGLDNYKIPKNFGQSTAIVAVHFINKNSLNLGAYEILKKDALDLYPFLRSIYEQKRLSDIEE